MTAVSAYDTWNECTTALCKHLPKTLLLCSLDAINNGCKRTENQKKFLPSSNSCKICTVDTTP